MCVCVFIKLHITTQSGPVILVILCVCVYFLKEMDKVGIPTPFSDKSGGW